MVCPDTYNVVDINKALVDKFKGLTGKDKQSSEQYDLRIFKLFAKHIKPEEQQEALGQKHPNAKAKRVLAVYVGTPNRLLKLQEMGAFDLGLVSDRFRHLVIDCRLNKKNFSIFECKETRADTLKLIQAANTAFNRRLEDKDNSK